MLTIVAAPADDAALAPRSPSARLMNAPAVSARLRREMMPINVRRPPRRVIGQAPPPLLQLARRMRPLLRRAERGQRRAPFIHSARCKVAPRDVTARAPRRFRFIISSRILFCMPYAAEASMAAESMRARYHFAATRAPCTPPCRESASSL